MKKVVVGLVGDHSSGKGTAAEVFKNNGYAYCSLSDLLRKIASEFGLTDERNTLILLGNTLRENFGNDVLAKGILQWINRQEGKLFIVDSIYHPEEVKLLKQEEDAYILGVTMSQEKCFELMKNRNRPGDPKTWEEFLELCEKEKDVGNHNHVEECLKLANKIIPNEGSIFDFQKKIDEIALVRKTGIEGGFHRNERYY